MKIIKYILGALLAGAALAATAQTADPAAAQAKRQEITQLLETTQALALSQQMASAFITQINGGIRTKRPDIPQTALDFLPATVQEVMRDNAGAFKEMFVGLYDKHFSIDEIRALNVFYASAVGKKLIEKQPILMQQGMTLGAEWGRVVGPEIDRRVREKLAAQGIKL